MATVFAGISNYKTTLVGAAIAGLTAVGTYQGHGGAKGYLLAFAIAAFGFVAHDAK